MGRIDGVKWIPRVELCQWIDVAGGNGWEVPNAGRGKGSVLRPTYGAHAATHTIDNLLTTRSAIISASDHVSSSSNGRIAHHTTRHKAPSVVTRDVANPALRFARNKYAHVASPTRSVGEAAIAQSSAVCPSLSVIPPRRQRCDRRAKHSHSCRPCSARRWEPGGEPLGPTIGPGGCLSARGQIKVGGAC